MITADPGATFEARVTGFPTGFAGVVRVSILDNVGGTVFGPSTSGIIEDPAGSGSYAVTLTAPATAGQFSVFWDTGTASPYTTASEDLIVTGSTFSGADPLATNLDLAARLGLTLTSAEQARADVLLDQASSLIRSHCKQTISKITGDVLVTRGNWGNRLLLPERPVIQVTSVVAQFFTQTPVTIDPTTYYVDRDELVRYDWPLSFTVGNGWLGPGWQLTITYDHGFDLTASPVPYKLGVCKAICLDAVIRAWVNPGNLAQSEVGGILESYPPGSGMLLTAEEKYNLDDLFRKEHASISLR